MSNKKMRYSIFRSYATAFCFAAAPVIGASAVLASIVLASIVTAVSVNAAEHRVNNQSEFHQLGASLAPGDTVVLTNGDWKDFEIVFEGTGTSEHPITLTAEDKGKVILSGQSNLRLAGDYLVVSGLVFKNGFTPTDSVISFRKNKRELANHSRVTETVIDDYSNPERFEADYWVAIYGKHNRFDHNHLSGKRNKGVTMAVRLDSVASQENHHRVDHNYFGPRATLGSNGGETLRVGTSHYSLENSYTLIENNFFDRCDGEVEIVSIKSGSNQVRGNVFYESRGTLTLRHGNDNLVEGNVFMGNGTEHTGGIRVINKRQTIRNNYLEGLKGYRFGGALVVMNGVPNSPINRYHPVEEAVIENNSIIHSDHIELAAGSDEERSAVPTRSRFARNLIVNDGGRDIFSVNDDVSGIRFSDNVLNMVSDLQISEGFVSTAVDLVRAPSGLLFPIDKNPTIEALPEVGAPRALAPVRKQDTGVSWFPKPEPAVRFGSGEVIEVAAGVDSLTAAMKGRSAGSVLRLAAGRHTVTKVLLVDKPVSIVADGDALIDFERSTLFEIADGGSLHLRGLSITGESAPDYSGNSVIRTSRYSMLKNYEISIEDTDIVDLDVNRFFNVLSVSKSTMADHIRITNSRFSDISGAILKLDPETDDYGIYNAEYITITDSSFHKIAGALVDIYRGGTDESTFGPHFVLTGSTLTDIGNGARNKSGASVHLHGVQVANLEDNEFLSSAPVKIFHTVGEPITKIQANTFANTDMPEVFELNSDEVNTAIISDNKKISD
ncbi:MAG: chondroitinase-B domain-containing protein [Congregibacter sp.]